MEDGIKWYHALFIVIFTFTLGFLAASAPKCINETEKTELVVVEDVYYSPSYTVIVPIGKFLTTRVVPAEYWVYVTYKGEEYGLGGSVVYNLYKDKVGQKVTATIITHEYDNQTTKTEVILPI